MKKVLIAGCCGEIGQSLYYHLKDRYFVIPCDIVKNDNLLMNYHQIDFRNYADVKNVFSEEHIDAVISLIGIKEMASIPSPDVFSLMSGTYLSSTYNILSAMRETKVKKFIMASSNHVTDYYENDGFSTLNREICVDDYPKSKSVYGSLKLAAESVCFNFFVNCGIQSICFRIGTYRRNFPPHYPDRWKRTMLSTVDLIHYFAAAIEHPTASGVNFNKPWNINSLTQVFK